MDLDQVNISHNKINQIYVDPVSMSAEVSIRNSHVNNTGASNVGVMLLLQKGNVSMTNNVLVTSDGNFELVNVRLETSGANSVSTLVMSKLDFNESGARKSALV